MKKVILFELTLLFLATTFVTDSPPPGWYQQTIPIGNKLITDIQFLDSLNGWVITDWGPAFDTAYVFRTSNGGVNWDFQYRFHGSFFALQFTDYNTGYIVGSTGSGKVWKTTNGGVNWNIWSSFGANPIRDLCFVSHDTGWICSDDGISGGVYKTTNGGLNWNQQLNNTYLPRKLFFINNDTGWVGTNDVNGKLFITTNSGINWNLQYTFNQQINDIYFLTDSIGIVSSGVSYRTTNGGYNWVLTNDGGIKLSFANDSVGWAGNNSLTIIKTTTGGLTWFRQTTNVSNPSVSVFDSLIAWAGGSALIHTTDGGGPPAGIVKINNETPTAFSLYQNYPNPFNPDTKIKYQITKSGNVKLIVYDITGKEIEVLVSQKQNAGTYEADFSGNGLSSGVYFYQLTISNEQSAVVFRETMKMVLIK